MRDPYRPVCSHDNKLDHFCQVLFRERRRINGLYYDGVLWYGYFEAGADMWIQMSVNTVLFDSKNSSYIVVLKDETGTKLLPIWIGAAEGNSIALAMSNMKAGRPLTHDLITSIFDRLEIEIARVVVSDLIDNTFYASLYLLQNSKEFHIDSRPSDAIAIAIRVGAPIFVQEEVLAKQDQSTLDNWMKNLGEGGGTEHSA
jgi:bifunctional DNase/RNase